MLSACQTTQAPLSQTPKASDSVPSLYDYQLRNKAGQPISMATLLNDIEDADVVMVGEWHAHPAVHLFQAKLMAQLAAQAQPLTLSMEQFTRADQAELDRYLAGEIGESSLLKNTQAWDNYESDYRPLVEIARQNQLPVIAANAPRNIVKCVGRQGPEYIQALDDERKALVAKNIDVSDSPYRQKFLGNMHGMALPESRIVKMFGAQMTWDATMAESIATHLAAHPERKVLHVAGRFHVIGGLGTGAELLKLNPDLRIVYISAITADEDTTASDYQLVVEALPPMWVSKEERMALMGEHTMSQVDCN